MKKLICIILAILLAAGCAGGLAEGASSSGEMKILLVKEDVTASVYAEPGDGTAIDQLAGGTLCCAVGDPVKAGDVEYLLVFYLDSEKKGALGYIDAEDAQLLTEEEVKALLQDPEKMNALLDLVDAMNDLLMSQDGDTTGETGSGTSGSRKNASAETIPLLRQLYDQLTGALSRLFSFDLSEIAGNVADAAKTAVKDAAEVISEKFNETKEKLGQFAKTLEGKFGEAKEIVVEKFNEAKKTVEENWPAVEKKAGEILDTVKESAEEKFNEAKKTVEENWPAVEKKAGEILDAAKEKVDEILPEVQEKAADIVDSVKEKYEEFNEDPDAFLEDLKKDVTEKLEELDAASGNAAGSLLDKVAELSTNLEDLVNSDTFTLVKSAIPAFAENYREQGFSKGTETLVNMIKLAIDFMNQSSSGDN